MTIHELADLFRIQLKICRRPNFTDTKMEWYSHLENVEVKDGAILIGVFGNGATIAEAVGDYVSRLQGKTVVVNAYSDDLRTTFTIPKQLTV